jgi:hypothetical protein
MERYVRQSRSDITMKRFFVAVCRTTAYAYVRAKLPQPCSFSGAFHSVKSTFPGRMRKVPVPGMMEPEGMPILKMSCSACHWLRDAQSRFPCASKVRMLSTQSPIDEGSRGTSRADFPALLQCFSEASLICGKIESTMGALEHSPVSALLGDTKSILRRLQDFLGQSLNVQQSMEAELKSKEAELKLELKSMGTELKSKEAELKSKEAELRSKEAELRSKEAALNLKELEKKDLEKEAALLNVQWQTATRERLRLEGKLTSRGVLEYFLQEYHSSLKRPDLKFKSEEAKRIFTAAVPTYFNVSILPMYQFVLPMCGWTAQQGAEVVFGCA